SRQKRSLGLEEGGAAFVKVSGGCRSLFAKLFGPTVVRGREFQGRVGLVVFALGAILVRLIGARIDYEQHLSLLDHIALLELHFPPVREPLTFGRTSTVPKGARRPVYSSQSFTSRCSAAVTVTTGGGRSTAFFSSPQAASSTTAKIPKGRVIFTCADFHRKPR